MYGKNLHRQMSVLHEHTEWLGECLQINIRTQHIGLYTTTWQASKKLINLLKSAEIEK